MKTIDIHLHLLSSDVKFDRVFDKLALYFFGKKMGFTAKELLGNPYDTYVKNLVDGIRDSEHITKTVFPVPFTTIFNTYDIPWSRRFALNTIANPFDRYAKSILEYFPKESMVYSNWEKVVKIKIN